MELCLCDSIYIFGITHRYGFNRTFSGIAVRGIYDLCHYRCAPFFFAADSDSLRNKSLALSYGGMYCVYDGSGRFCADFQIPGI